MSANLEASTFTTEWNALERPERLRLQHLARMGRKPDEPELARLMPGYARWQMARPWMRLFWLWFVPGVAVMLSIATQIHPVFLGVAIALGAQAVFAHYNLRKLARGSA